MLTVIKINKFNKKSLILVVLRKVLCIQFHELVNVELCMYFLRKEQTSSRWKAHFSLILIDESRLQLQQLNVNCG